MPGRGNLFWTERTAKAFWGTGAGAELRKGSGVGWTEKTELVSSDGVVVAWPDLQRKGEILFRLKTCRDLERVFLGNDGEKTSKHMVIGANDVALSI